MAREAGSGVRHAVRLRGAGASALETTSQGPLDAGASDARADDLLWRHLATAAAAPERGDDGGHLQGVQRACAPRRACAAVLSEDGTSCSLGPTRGRELANDPAVELGLWNLTSMDIITVHGDYDGFVTGDAFTDGSLLYGAYAALRRGGWSLVQLTADMELRCACYGHLPRAQWEQTIFKSELMAVLRVQEVACPPAVICTDCQSVIDGFLKWQAGPLGPARCTAMRGPAAGPWSPKMEGRGRQASVPVK